MPILTKFRNDWVKIVDLLLKTYFWVSPDSPLHACMTTYADRLDIGLDWDETRVMIWHFLFYQTKFKSGPE